MTRAPCRSSGDGSKCPKWSGVFDFTEDDARVEEESKKHLEKYGDRSRKTSSAVDKYTFLTCFAQDTMTRENKSLDCVIDVEDKNSQEVKTPEVGQSGKLSDNRCIIEQKFTGSASDDTISISSSEGVSKEENSGLATQLQTTFQNFEREPINVIPDDSYELSSSTSMSTLVDDEVSILEEASRCGPCGHEIDGVNRNVIVFPDFIFYGAMYTEVRVTFSSSFVKVECSSVDASKEKLCHLWDIEDIISIQSCWCLKVETAILNFKLRDSKGTCDNEASGLSPLKFAVYDPNWSIALEAIKLLSTRYKYIWNVIFEESDEDPREGRMSRPFWSSFIEPFIDVIYPQGDPDPVLISKRDVAVLQPASFINDTIIDFYIKYLYNKIQPEAQKRFHFFNSFFFRKLVNLDKGRSSISEGREAFQRVRKWTKKVDLFGKDYILIPVNYSLHWSLIVICHPGEVVHFKDEEAEKSHRVPCILHMDSIRGSHPGLKNLFQGYLCEEWKERNGDNLDDVPFKLLRLRFISLELPQQDNSFDCGLFLLQYVERFLAEAPANFSPLHISKSSSFLSRNWFPPAEASLKREYILNLLYSIMENHTHDIPSSSRGNNHLSSEETDKNKQQTEITKMCRVRKPHDGCSMSYATPPPETLPSAPQSPKIFLEPAIKTGNYRQAAALLKKNIMSPIEEIGESCERNLVSDIKDCREISGQANAFKTKVHTDKGSGQIETSWNKLFTLNVEESDEDDSVCITSVRDPRSMPVIQLHEDIIHLESTECNQGNQTDGLESPLLSVEELNSLVVEDSLGTDVDEDDEDSASSSRNIRNISWKKEDLNL